MSRLPIKTVALSIACVDTLDAPFIKRQVLSNLPLEPYGSGGIP